MQSPTRYKTLFCVSEGIWQCSLQKIMVLQTVESLIREIFWSCYGENMVNQMDDSVKKRRLACFETFYHDP